MGGKQGQSARSKVPIGGFQSRRVVGGKIIFKMEPGGICGEADDGVSIAGIGGVKRSVGDDPVDVSIFIRRQRISCHPNRALAGIRCRAKETHTFQRDGIIGHDPPMIVVIVHHRSVGEKDDLPVVGHRSGKGQAGTTDVAAWIKGQSTVGAADACSRNASGDHHGTSGPFGTGDDVQRMQSVDISPVLFGKNLNEKCQCIPVNNRRGRDSHLGKDGCDTNCGGDQISGGDAGHGAIGGVEINVP